MTLPILTAVTDASWEADLVAGLAGAELGVHVVRRCVDVADLLAAAAAGTAEAVVLSADLRRLDGNVLGRLEVAGVAVVALVRRGDESAERRLRQLGVASVLSTDAGLEAIADALVTTVAATRSSADRDPSLAAFGDPAAAIPRLRHSTEVSAPPAGSGRVCAVWGPTGAPGRTTVAIGVADEAARSGTPTLLIDADTYGGSIGQVLGFLDEAPGLAAATRLAGNGRLDLPALTRLARRSAPGLRVLTGITRADRWPEVPGAGVAAVLEIARRLDPLIVVDCGFSLEADEEIVYDTAAPRRNGATLAALAAADIVVVVGAADPVGLHRLVRSLLDLREMLPGQPVKVVVNKLRRGITPGDPRAVTAAALRRHAAVLDATFLPYDSTALDRALGTGRTLAEAAPGSDLRRCLAALAAELSGGPAPASRRHRRRAG